MVDVTQDPVEFAAAAKELKSAGKIKFVGVSNFAPSQVDMLQAALQKQGVVLTTSGRLLTYLPCLAKPVGYTHHALMPALLWFCVPWPTWFAEVEISPITPTSLYDGRLHQLQKMGIAPLAWGPLGKNSTNLYYLYMAPRLGTSGLRILNLYALSIIP